MKPRQEKRVDWFHFMMMIGLISGGLGFWVLVFIVTRKLAM